MEDTVKLAVLGNEVENVKKELKDTKEIAIRIEGKMDAHAKSFASKEDLADVDSRIDKEVLPAIKEIRTKNQFKENLLWIGLLASAILNVVMVYQIFGGK